MEPIVNKIAQSGIITIDLENFSAADESIAVFDLKPFLFKEMILREKDFRAETTAFDWTIYQDKIVAVFCSADAIVPMWAYMLVTSKLKDIAQSVHFGNKEEVKEQILLAKINAIPEEEYVDKRVVIKGCSDHPLPTSAYVAISNKMLPTVASLMFGEPCSTVPVYKKKKIRNVV